MSSTLTLCLPGSFRLRRFQLPAYAACAEGRTFSVVWACRDKLAAANDCMRPLYVQLWLDLRSTSPSPIPTALGHVRLRLVAC